MGCLAARHGRIMPRDPTPDAIAPAAYIALAGPTAAGKTAIAMALARRFPIEIISVDSALVYRGMDIGTAKPSQSERAEVPHHLIDICDPLHAYSAARFAQDAKRLIAGIRAAGKWPLLVGGTMLYFKALTQGLDDMPSADTEIREQIAGEASEHGWPALHRRLQTVDPLTAARLAPNDAQRISRALEVYRVSGQALSAFHRGSAKKPSQAAEPAMPFLSLEPTDRAWLHQRIAQRLEAMLAQGFLDEVRALRARADLQPDLPSMRCVGYRQAWAFLDGRDTEQGFRDAALFATRQLAKRQITWLRSMPERQIMACDQPGVIDQALARVDAFMKDHPT